MTVVLCTIGLGTFEVWVVGSRYRHMVADRIATDDESTGVNTCTTDCSLQHLSILDGIGHLRIARRFGLLKFSGTLNGIGQIHLHTIRQTIWDCLTQSVRIGQRQFLHTRHILDGVLCGHRGVGDDMGTVLVTVFVFYPFQHPTSSVIVEVGIDIRERDTVRIEETLKQQVVFQRVDLRDTQAVGHHRSGSRTTSWAYHHT